jgi:hypothetical protein
MAELELVRCGCGLVRNDEDAAAPVHVWQFLSANRGKTEPGESPYEIPRLCRGCGSLYMLPKQTAPSSSGRA